MAKVTARKVILDVLGDKVEWMPGFSQVFNNTTYTKTSTNKDFVMKWAVTTDRSLEKNKKLIAKLETALRAAGFPVHSVRMYVWGECYRKPGTSYLQVNWNWSELR